MVSFPHLAYSPDLAPADFHLFPKIKMQLNGCHFDTVVKIQSELQRVFGLLEENAFQTRFQKWQECSNRCIAAQGDCFEGDGVETEDLILDLLMHHISDSGLCYLELLGNGPLQLPEILIDDVLKELDPS